MGRSELKAFLRHQKRGCSPADDNVLVFEFFQVVQEMINASWTCHAYSSMSVSPYLESIFCSAI
ncbi:hypothetical protein WDW37_17210 [Bdellovibrionota bacterium FG-1]